MKTLSKFEFTAIAIAAIGLLFKFMHWPFGGVLTVLGLSSLSIVYFFLGQKLFLSSESDQINQANVDELDADLLENDEDTSPKNKGKFISVLAGISLAVVIIGLLFKIQFWPMANQHLAIGLLGLLASTVLSIYKYQLTKSKLFVSILKRTLVIGAFGLVMYSISDDTWLVIRYGNHPEYIEAVRAARANPESELLWAKVEEEREKMQNPDSK
jgi:hypothetical protein